MESLLEQMEHCKTVDECIDVATVDAYGEYEQAESWRTCIEEIFGGVKTVRALGQEVKIERFELINDLYLVAVCRKEKRLARVALVSIEFPKLTRVQRLWLKAWGVFSGSRE